MKNFQLTVLLIGTTVLLAGCFLNRPEAVQHLVKDFSLSWQNDPELQALYVNRDHNEHGGLKLVDKKVFAVGYDEDFIIALQQPQTSTFDTVYHIVDIREYSIRFWSPSEHLYSFQTKQEFQKKKLELGVSDLEVKAIVADGEVSIF
ncbi:MAG: hypothetical protein DHS20C17_29000 [Cyclobacteriaceae bacterium]|nr:MAG: hypothetical protein DHS20C17_29000 [Cyclobacteriaceae bacterium]